MNHREYFNQLAGKWDRMVTEEAKSRLPQLIKELAIKPGDAILDVGGGTGILLPFLYKAAGDRSRIVSLDISEEMLKQAINNGYPSSIHYIHADVAAIPLASEMFDLVICYSCLPHFPDKPKSLIEMARVLRNGGRLVICHTASRHEINELHKSIGNVIGNDTIPDEATMRKMLATSGLKRIKIQDEAHHYLAIAIKATILKT
jgi:ubiquinone/menaquinone biosynthesis C-methylase UbiE